MKPKPHRLAQSYIADQYMVSTVYRQSSAQSAPDHWYYETIVWEYDPVTRELGDTLFTDGHSGVTIGAALSSHASICEHWLSKSELAKESG